MLSAVDTVDIVLPIYNEEKSLRKNILALFDYLTKIADFSWNIIIADNASTDKTPEIGRSLSAAYDKIIYTRIDRKGRGYALKAVFSQSNADIVSYMDIDLSTNLRHLKSLICAMQQDYDAAIGSRLMPGARVKRSMGREILSRSYNALIKILFFNKFSDAQCGFKAFKTSVVKQFIRMVENNNWFFDTEILLLMEHNKCRIFEVAVEWVEDMRTKVNIPKTILEDLSGLLRMRLTIHKKEIAQ